MKTPLIVIVGETASGKSSLALQLAQRFNGEILCADSATVRAEANIGTAKPTAEECELVPHHLLDIAAPDAPFSAADFQKQAIAAIEDIAGRGKLPIMVGGTGLYIDAILYEYEFREAADPELRQRLSALSVEELQVAAEVEGLDTSEIDTNNPHRLIRFIETGGEMASQQPLRDNTLVFGLQSDREELNERIEQRVDTMLENGLEQEVRQLAKAYGWGAPALKTIGYREWQKNFLGHQDIAKTRSLIIKSTKGLAKRQRTWFKRNKSIHWISTPVDLESIVDSVTTFLQN